MRSWRTLEILSFGAALALAAACDAPHPPDPNVGETHRPAASTGSDPSNGSKESGAAPGPGSTIDAPVQATTPLPAETPPKVLDVGEVVVASRADLEKLRGYTRITGKLRVEHLRGAGVPDAEQVHDFAPLGALRELGSLVVTDTDTVRSFAGLEHLTKVHGVVDVRQNVALTEIDALASLEVVDDAITIGDRQTVTTTKPPGGLPVSTVSPLTSNSELTHVRFTNLTSAGSLSVLRSAKLTSVEVPNLGTITGSPFVFGVPNGLVIGFLPSLVSFTAPRLRTVVGAVIIGGVRQRVHDGSPHPNAEVGTPLNTSLESVTFPLLRVCDELSVVRNPKLRTLFVRGVTYSGDVDFERNDVLSSIELPNMASAGHFALLDSAFPGGLDLRSLKRISGMLWIEGVAGLRDLRPFARVDRIGGDAQFLNNPDLEAIDLRAALSMNSLFVASNPKLTAIDALPSLSHVQDSIEIAGNDGLTKIDLPALVDVGPVRIASEPALVSVRADKLGQIYGALEINTVLSLKSVSFAALHAVGEPPAAPGGPPATIGDVSLFFEGAPNPVLSVPALTHVHGALSLSPAPSFAVFAPLRRIGGDFTIDGPVARAPLDTFVNQVRAREGIAGNVVAPDAR